MWHGLWPDCARPTGRYQASAVGTQGEAQAGSAGQRWRKCFLWHEAQVLGPKGHMRVPQREKCLEAGTQRGQRSGRQGTLPWGGARVGWRLQSSRTAGQGRQAGGPVRWFVRSEGGLSPWWWGPGWEHCRMQGADSREYKSVQVECPG